MAAENSLQSLKAESTCPICLEYYNDPVTTDCAHNFCRSCITQCWNGLDTSAPCPQCRVMSPPQNLRPNRQLQNIADSVKELYLQPGNAQKENMCKKHEEKLKIFCQVDQTAICVICSISVEHKYHAMIPLEEAAQEIKVLQDASSSSSSSENPDDIIKNFKVVSTFDPCTANQRLILTENGRCVGWGNTAQTLPDNPKRFTVSPCVLASEGFSSGRHYWEVQLLQERGGWRVGACRESVCRKELVAPLPEDGFWAVEGWNGQYCALTSPEYTPLSLHERPNKLGVYLDFEAVGVSLYNADTMENLYTFTCTPFTERVFPFFCLWIGTELCLV